MTSGWTLSVALFLIGVVAGCTGAGAPSAGGVSSADADGQDDRSGGHGEQDKATREIAVDSWAKETFLPTVPPYCDPAQPGVCELYTTGELNLTGSFAGDGPMVARQRWDTTSNSLWVERKVWFTGKVADCGFGSLTLAFQGHLEPDTGAGTRLRADVWILPGSPSSGLVGIVDFQGKVDQTQTPAADHQPWGHVTGTIWCR